MLCTREENLLELGQYKSKRDGKSRDPKIRTKLRPQVDQRLLGSSILGTAGHYTGGTLFRRPCGLFLLSMLIASVASVLTVSLGFNLENEVEKKNTRF